MLHLFQNKYNFIGKLLIKLHILISVRILILFKRNCALIVSVSCAPIMEKYQVS